MKSVERAEEEEKNFRLPTKTGYTLEGIKNSEKSKLIELGNMRQKEPGSVMTAFVGIDRTYYWVKRNNMETNLNAIALRRRDIPGKDLNLPLVEIVKDSVKTAQIANFICIVDDKRIDVLKNRYSDEGSYFKLSESQINLAVNNMETQIRNIQKKRASLRLALFCFNRKNKINACYEEEKLLRITVSSLNKLIK